MIHDRETQAVLDSTSVLLRAIRNQTNLAYADAVWSPVSPITVGLMAQRFGAEIREIHLSPHAQEMGIPAYFGAAPLILINKDLRPSYRALALRHGLAHLIAGELDAEQGVEIRFMSTTLDWTTQSERRADLFALADLIPDREMRDDPDWLTAEIGAFAADWSSERLFDRASLRLLLWRNG